MRFNFRGDMKCMVLLVIRICGSFCVLWNGCEGFEINFVRWNLLIICKSRFRRWKRCWMWFVGCGVGVVREMGVLGFRGWN